MRIREVAFSGTGAVFAGSTAKVKSGPTRNGLISVADPDRYVCFKRSTSNTTHELWNY